MRKLTILLAAILFAILIPRAFMVDFFTGTIISTAGSVAATSSPWERHVFNVVGNF